MNLFIFIAVFGSSLASFAATEQPTLKILVDGLKSSRGAVQLTIFHQKQADDFPVKPENAKVSLYQRLVDHQKTEIEVSGLPPGEYAAFLYHDENEDRKINTNMVGIPTEGYGASAGAKNRFGPPRFKDAKFEITNTASKPTSITIKVDY